MSKISEPKINRKNVREEVKREFEKEDFIYSLIGELLEHYFTLFLALWLCAGYPFIYGLSIIWQKNDIGSGSFFIFLSIVVVIIIFKIRINYKKKINQKFDKKINQLKKKYYEKQKEKKLEETIIERIGKHVKEGYILTSVFLST